MKRDPAHYEQLTAYLDGELSEGERAAVERMLAEDAAARTLLVDLRRIAELVGSLPRERAPSDLADAVTARMEREALLGEAAGVPAAGSDRAGWYRLLSVAAAVGLVAIAGWLVFPQLPTGDRTERPLRLADGGSDGRDKGVGKDIDALPAAEAVARADRRRRGDPERPADGPSAGVPIVAQPPSDKTEKEHGIEAARPRIDVAQGRTEAILGKSAEKMPVSDGAAVPDEQMLGELAAAAAGDGPNRVPGAVALAWKTGTRGGRAARAPATEPTGGESKLGLEVQLGRNLLSNSLLREVAAENVSNRAAVYTSAANRDALLAVVDSFMASNGIPDAHQETFREPIQAREAFYLVQAPASPAPAGRAFALPPVSVVGDEVQVIMNLPADQAAALLSSIEAVGRENDASMSWTANGFPVAETDAVSEVIRQLVRADDREALGSPIAPALAEVEDVEDAAPDDADADDEEAEVAPPPVERARTVRGGHQDTRGTKEPGGSVEKMARKRTAGRGRGEAGEPNNGRKQKDGAGAPRRRGGLAEMSKGAEGETAEERRRPSERGRGVAATRPVVEGRADTEATGLDRAEQARGARRGAGVVQDQPGPQQGGVDGPEVKGLVTLAISLLTTEQGDPAGRSAPPGEAGPTTQATETVPAATSRPTTRGSAGV